MDRFQWRDLPPEARGAVTARFGEVVDVRSAPAGLTVGVATKLTTTDEPVFLKAIPLRSPALRHYRRELAVNQALPRAVGAPQLLWHGEIAGWLLLAFDYIPHGHEADLSPGSPDLTAALDAVGRLSHLLNPCPWPSAPPVANKVAGMLERAHSLLANLPGGTLVATCAQALDGFDPPTLTGPALAHADLHTGNLLVTRYGVRVLDWSLASRGPDWFDVALLVHRLIAAGHTPQRAETLACRVPAWCTAPADTVTAVAAARTLFAAELARTGPTWQRDRRTRAAQAGGAWIEHRLKLT